MIMLIVSPILGLAFFVEDKLILTCFGPGFFADVGLETLKSSPGTPWGRTVVMLFFVTWG